MAEEETGFTFVDKRRTAPEPAFSITAETSSAEMPAGEVSASADGFYSDETAPTASDLTADSDTAADAAPTTYDLIGYCINLLASQAWQKLGLLADPQTGEAQPDLAEAKVAIDAVSDLAARMDTAPDSVIPPDLRRDLRTLVNDLRLNYVSQRGPAV